MKSSLFALAAVSALLVTTTASAQQKVKKKDPLRNDANVELPKTQPAGKGGLKLDTKTPTGSLPIEGETKPKPGANGLELPKKQTTGMGVTNVGGYPDPAVESAVRFSTDLVTNLNEVKSAADTAYNNSGEEAAIKAYRDGVQGAVDTAVAREHRIGLVYRNLERLLRLQETLTAIGANASAQKKVYDLFFVTLAEVSVFDRTHFVAHASKSKRVDVDAAGQSAGLQSYAKNLIDRSRRALTFDVNGAAVPYFGSAKIYFSAMATIVGGLEQDLTEAGLDSLQIALHDIKGSIDSELNRVDNNPQAGEALSRIAEQLSTLSKGI